ncbi:hypothetical protein GCM10011390_51020 [Aureimonas endophytica]|uniref:Peptide methionine sulfoxide reductase n=1 Tax=Aureimonas endophytica TaxID=2027858 RepID=A0A917ECZ3_9HYPH|nr:hypothetical protein [Aureimonas endophytica]GGE25367.1 hypothetical protein GCM10011390_51020 [Aureimonas endophytica]
MDEFLAALAMLPVGYGEGCFAGRRYGVTLAAAPDGRRLRLFGEELGGPDRISFNLYRLGDGTPRLKPCEMPAAKVVAFVLGYRPDRPGGAS